MGRAAKAGSGRMASNRCYGDTIGDQLGQGFAGRRCVEDTPDVRACGHIGAVQLRHLPYQRQPILRHRTEAGLPCDDPVAAEHG